MYVLDDLYRLDNRDLVFQLSYSGRNIPIVFPRPTSHCIQSRTMRLTLK